MPNPKHLLSALLLAAVLLVPAAARADSRWGDSPLALQGHTTGWATWYVFGEAERDTDETSYGIGILAFGEPYLVLRGAWFVTADSRYVWSGVEGSAGLALPFPLSPYAGAGLLAATVDDSSDANGNTILGGEAFYEWGAMLRIRPLWASWIRRSYTGHNGVPRGDETTLVSVGWSFDFE